MTGKEIILGLFLLFVIGLGAATIGYATSKGGKSEKPKVWAWGVLVLIFGCVLGYAVVDLILILEHKTE